MHRESRWYLNERGYTFVESILQLIIFALFAEVFVLIMLWTGHFQSTALTKEHTEWELFVNDLLNYVAVSQKVEVVQKGHGIRVTQLERVVEVEQYEQLIRKQVDGLGHEPMLIGVKSVEFNLQQTKLFLKVEFLNGLQKEREIIVPI